jgi:hypothetical protein
VTDTPTSLAALLARWADGAPNNTFTPQDMRVILLSVQQLFQVYISTSYANDVAAAAGGVPIGQVYRNGNILQVRLS